MDWGSRQTFGMTNSYWLAIGAVAAIGGLGEARKRGVLPALPAMPWGSAAMDVNADVARAWGEGLPAKAKHFRTDGETLWSYSLPIGITKGDRKILYNYSASGQFRSMTTSQHVSRAKKHANEVVDPPSGSRATHRRGSRTSRRDLEEYGGADEKDFIDWLVAADRIVEKRTGVGILDLPDWNWRDAYDDGLGPAIAAGGAIEQARG